MRWVAVMLAAAFAMPASAEIVPQPGAGDPHIQSVVYDPDQVVTLRVAPGFAVSIEFSPDERIENVVVGNSGSWQATPNRRGDHVFVKPLGGAGATNMTVITDARRYDFSLVPAEAIAPDLPYSVRFTYPGLTRAPDVVVEPLIARYKLGGDKSLWPLAISDDGTFTSIVWPRAATIPAVYLVDSHGRETLANGAMRDGAYVIDGVVGRIVLRLGKVVASARRIVKSSMP